MSSISRVSGLVSGIDTDSLVSQLMKAEKIPLDKLNQKKQTLAWQQTDYRTLNTKLLDLKNTAFNMRLTSTYNQFNAASSNDSIVSATATSGASATSYTLNSITSLAKASNIATADGQNISRDTSVITGGSITTVDATTNNTFKISYNGQAFVDVTLDAKVYDGATPGKMLSDLVSDMQTKVDTALGTQGVAAGTVKVSLTKNNTIQFTTNDYPTSAAPKSIVLQEGDANDLLKAGLSFNTDATTKQISSTVKKVDLDQSIYSNLLQHRFKNTEDFGWIVNGSDSQTLGVAADNVVSTVNYNNTNISNYNVTAIENQTIAVGAETDNLTSTINYNSGNLPNVSVYVDGTKYSVVTGKSQSDLGATEVLAADDGSGKLKITFKSNLTVGANVQVDQKTTYSVVTGKAQADLGVGEALLSDDGTGKANFTFKNQMDTGTKITVDRHDFEISTSVYNQDGTVSNTAFNVNAMNETMNSLISRIGASSTSGLSAFYDTGTDKIIFNTKKTGDNYTSGDDKDIILTGNFLTSGLQMTKYTDGEDVAFSINGLSTTRKDNSFTINGVSFTLKGTSINPVNVTVTQDTDKIYNSIKDFVDKYNDTIALFNTKYSEKRDRNYTPLTDDQKSSMKDTDITNWETKAKVGLVHGDTILSSVTTNMRNSFYSPVSGVSDSNYSQLTQIGITSSSIYQDQGKLVIDEAKLKAAISASPDKVVELFTKTSSATDAIQNNNESGIAVRIYNNATNGVKSLTTKAGQDGSYYLYDTSNLGLEITRTDTDIYDLQDKLNEKENNYYIRFSALETYINKMNTQSSWLSQQFSTSS